MHLWMTVVCQIVLVLQIVVGVVAELRILAFVVRLDVLVGLFVVGFVIGLAFTGTGLLSETFPVSGIDLVRESLHGFESGGFPLLSHNVFDSFRETGIIAVSKNGIVPICADRKLVKLNVIFD